MDKLRRLLREDYDKAGLRVGDLRGPPRTTISSRGSVGDRFIEGCARQ